MPGNHVDTLVVGRIGKPHGLKGEISIELRTDEPEHRFSEGSVLLVESDRSGSPVPSTLTVAASRWHQGRLLIRFEEIADRTAAETLRGVRLVVPLDPDLTPEDPEEFYDYQLVGLHVVTTAGESIGELVQVVHGAAQDLLVVKTDERELLVPFVQELVPLVDLAAGRIQVVDLPGLLREVDG